MKFFLDVLKSMGTQKLKCLKAISQKVFLNHPNMYIYIYIKYCGACLGLFFDGTHWYSVPGNENEECIFCMLVMQYHYNKSWYTGNFRDLSRETVSMYKTPGDQNSFQKDWVKRNFCLVNND